jgi:hypothetical protein
MPKVRRSPSNEAVASDSRGSSFNVSATMFKPASTPLRRRLAIDA